MLVGSASLVGKGEDRHCLLEASINGERIVMMLLADGHGGPEAADAAAGRVLKQVMATASDGSHAALHLAVVQAFRDIHEHVRASGTSSGASLTVVCTNVSRSEISSWNVGDSLVLLVESEHHVQMSVSHRIETNLTEQARLARACVSLARVADAAGEPSGPLRIRKGGVALARAIGDVECGDAILPDPHSMCRQITSSSIALLLVSSSIAERVATHELAKRLRARGRSKQTSADEVASHVLQLTARAWGDVTVLVHLMGGFCSVNGCAQIARARTDVEAWSVPTGPAFFGATPDGAPLDAWTVDDGDGLLAELRNNHGRTTCAKQLLHTSLAREPPTTAARLLRGWRLFGDVISGRSVGAKRRTWGSRRLTPPKSPSTAVVTIPAIAEAAVLSSPLSERHHLSAATSASATDPTDPKLDAALLKVATALAEGNSAPALTWISLVHARGLDRALIDADTLLHKACAAGSVEVVETLLRAGASHDLPGRGGHRPLHYAAMNDHEHIAKLVLAAKADPDAYTSLRQTPLMLAAAKGHIKLVALILASGAEFMLRDGSGMTAAMTAQASGQKAVGVALKRHAKLVRKQDKGGEPMALQGDEVAGDAATPSPLMQRPALQAVAGRFSMRGAH